MKPIYFPFTYVSGPAATALAACFKQTVVYQPSRHNIPAEIQMWADRGIIDLRVPIVGDENKLEAILKDYNAWANQHQGSTLDFFKAWGGKIPFFDETFSSQIRAEIKKKSSPGQSQKEDEDIFRDRLFLHMAQEFDLQNNGLNQDLKLFDAMEQDLMKNLKGEDESWHLETAGKEKFPFDDPGFYMAVERLKAWAKLMQHDRETSGLFITTSRSVLDELIDKTPEIEMVIDFDSIPMHASRDEKVEKWQDGLLASLNTLLTSAWPVSTDGMFEAPVVSGGDENVAIKLYIVAGETPYDFFVRCVGDNSPQAGLETERVRFKNTLIGIVEL